MLRSTGNDKKAALLTNIERSDIHVVLMHLLQSEQSIFKLDNIKTGLTLLFHHNIHSFMKSNEKC